MITKILISMIALITDADIDGAIDSIALASYIRGFRASISLGILANSKFKDTDKFAKNKDDSYQRKDGGSARMNEHGDFVDDDGKAVKNSDMAPNKNYGKGGLGRAWDAMKEATWDVKESLRGSFGEESMNKPTNNSSNQEHNPKSNSTHNTETKHGSSFISKDV